MESRISVNFGGRGTGAGLRVRGGGLGERQIYGPVQGHGPSRSRIYASPPTPRPLRRVNYAVKNHAVKDHAVKNHAVKNYAVKTTP